MVSYRPKHKILQTECKRYRLHMQRRSAQTLCMTLFYQPGYLEMRKSILQVKEIKSKQVLLSNAVPRPSERE